MHITLATRRSALALWQTRWAASLLEQHTQATTALLELSTRGDEQLDRSLSAIGGKGLFLKELEAAILDGRADLAVHSLKDVPAESVPKLVLAACLPRATPWDAFVSNQYACWQDLPQGARVGTSSPRRQLQLLHKRPDIQVVPVRGNVQTRLDKMDQGDCDALLLACAGLERLGLGERIRQVLHTPEWIPAAAQGVVVVQCRNDDDALRAMLGKLHDHDNAALIAAERSVIAALQGDCHTPLGVYAEQHGQQLTMYGVLGKDVEPGQPVKLVTAQRSGSLAESAMLARQLAADLATELAELVSPRA